MSFSTNHFLLLPIAAMMISTVSSVIIVCLNPEVLVYCDDYSDENSKLLDENNHTLNCDDDDPPNIFEIKFLCTTGRLEYIPRNVLKHFWAAEIIDVSYDWVQRVETEDFLEIGHLRELHMDHNELTQLPAYLFNYTPKIEFADFSDNEIISIDPNTFAVGVDHLKKINLSANRIKQLDARTFMNAVSLTDINLRSNQMAHIGMRLVQFNDIMPLDPYHNSSLNCMILPLMDSKVLHIRFSQLLLIDKDSVDLAREIEIDCDTAQPHMISSSGVFDIHGVNVTAYY